MANGLVLEGGALRGLYTCGVMDVLWNAGIRFDSIIGVSAGAVFGCNYKSGQPGRVLRYNKRFCRDWRYCSLRSLLTTGDLFGAKFCYQDIPLELDPFDCAAFEQDPTSFYVVCTDVLTGKPVYRKCEKADAESFEWMRASASMPLVSRKVELDGKFFLDGAVADSIPLRYFEQNGLQKNVVILTQPAGFEKHRPAAFGLIRFLLRKYPVFLQALETRHERYNEAVRYVEEQEKQGNVFLIRPDKPLEIKRLCHDPARLQRTYDCGRMQAERLLPDLKQFLFETAKK